MITRIFSQIVAKGASRKKCMEKSSKRARIGARSTIYILTIKTFNCSFTWVKIFVEELRLTMLLTFHLTKLLT